MGGSSSVTIGYKYYLGMHMVICHGPVDSVQKVIVGEREAWSGNATSSQQIYINSPELFGGRKKEGGIQGYVDLMFGEQTQTANSYLLGQLGNPMPAFRGVLSAVLRRVYVCAMSAYPKPWAFKVKRIPAKTWYSTKADINGSANPVHVVYETLTNTDWGMGYPISAIDDTAFKAAADKCYSEGLGVSMLLSNQDSIEKFIYDVLGHMNGMLYTRPDNGQFSIKLLRDDYTVSSLSTFNESNVVTLESFERPSYAEMVNEIVVVYRPQGGVDDDSVTVQDLASIQAQGGIVSQTVQYPGIDTAVNASRLAMRDLRQKSTPLSRIRIHVNRKAWNVVIGGVFKFSWAEHGLVDIVYRALSINYGTLTEGTIVIDAVEDVFGLPTSTYIGNQSSGWVDPIVSPSEFTTKRVEEANYFDIATRIGEADLALVPSTAAYYYGVTAQPNNYCQDYELWLSTNSGSTYSYGATAQPAPYAILSADITPIQTTINYSTYSSNLEFTSQLIGTYALIDNEIVRIDTINLATKQITVGRGCLDTVPVAHVLGTMFICAEYASARIKTEYTIGTNLYNKFLMRTSLGLFDLTSALPVTKSLGGRFNKPYAPGNLKFNNVSYPPSFSGELTVSWAHRDRTQQLVRPIIDHTSANIGPEVGVTYTIKLYDQNSVLRKTVTGLTTTSYTWTSEATDSGFSSISYVGGNTVSYVIATSQIVTNPTIVANDLLIAWVMHRDTLTPPAGWTLVRSIAFTNATLTQYLSVYKKTAVSGDSGASVTWTQATSQCMAVHVQAFRHAAIADVLSYTERVESNSSSPETVDFATITPTIAGQMIVSGVSQTTAYVSPTVTNFTASAGTLTTPSSVADNRLAVVYRSTTNTSSVFGNVTTNIAPTSTAEGAISLILTAPGVTVALNNKVKAEVFSVRSSVQSHQTATWEANRV